MRELVTVISCDLCRANDTKTPARVSPDAPEIRVIIDGRRMRLDVCAEHSNPSWSDIVAYAWPDELPTPIDVSRRTPPPSALTLVCPICDKRAGRNAHGLNVHMSRVHRDVPLEERQRLTGLPVTTRNVNRHATRIGGGGDPDACPVCGKSPFHTYHGLVMHMTKAHREIAKAQRDELIEANA